MRKILRKLVIMWGGVLCVACCFIFFVQRAYHGEIAVVPIAHIPIVKACKCVTMIRDIEERGGIFIPNQDKHIYKNFKNITANNNVVTDEETQKVDRKIQHKSNLDMMQSEILKVMQEHQLALNAVEYKETPDDLFDVLETAQQSTKK